MDASESPTPTNGSDTTSLLKINPQIDFEKTLTKYSAARYVIEVCTKLDSSVLTTATALHYFQTFYQHCSFDDYDPYTIGCTCIHLAGKVVNDYVRIRDIINVGIHCLKKNSEPLIKDKYFQLRDAITNAELLIMRVLGFKLKIDLPHKYILQYLRALEDWLGKDASNNIPVNETAWQLLQDAYHDELIIKCAPELIAATCVNMALEIYGVVVPHDLVLPWYSTLHESCTKSAVNELTFKIFSLYQKEKKLTMIED